MSDLQSTGKIKEYPTGAVRDASEGKGFPHMIPPSIMRRLSVHFERGAKKYAKYNWMAGIPLSHYNDSIHRHIWEWEEGSTLEDNVAAIVWNAVCMGWTEEQIRAGKLPQELDDLPYRKHPTLSSCFYP